MKVDLKEYLNQTMDIEKQECLYHILKIMKQFFLKMC